MNQDLFEELKEKNSVARSARASAVGGKKKYMLPSDYLSSSEKKKLNGEITVYKLREPITWNEFKSYPHDIQVQYLEFLRDELGVSPAWFKRLTGVSDGTLYPYFRENNLKGILLKYPDMSKAAEFDAWLRSAASSSVEEPTQEKPKAAPALKTPPMFYNVISSCEMNLSGKASEISQMLFNIFQNQKIIVSVVLDGDNDETEPGVSEDTETA